MANSSNIGRNFLICGVLLGLGAAAGGVYVMNSTSHDPLPTSVQGGDERSTALTEKSVKIKEEAMTARRIVDVAPPLEEAWIPRASAKDGKLPRFTPLFFAPTIWQVPDAAQKKNVAVDLMDAGSRPLHKVVPTDPTAAAVPVPNSWFFSYGLDELLCSPQALTTDSDGDGFTNGEEFLAKTIPVDAKSMPSFVSGNDIKMVVVGEKHVLSHLLELSMASNFDAQNVNITVLSDAGVRMLQHKELKVGDKLGLGDAPSGPLGKDRFEVVAINSESNDFGMPSYSVTLKDNYTAVDDEKQIKISSGSKGRHSVQDVSVKLRLTAGPDKGKEVTARLGEEIAIPGFTGIRAKITSAGKKKTQVKVSVNGADPIDVPGDSPATPKKSSSQNKKK